MSFTVVLAQARTAKGRRCCAQVANDLVGDGRDDGEDGEETVDEFVVANCIRCDGRDGESWRIKYLIEVSGFAVHKQL